MDNRKKELSVYRLKQAEESLKASENCFENGFYKDSINRSYYSAFYSVKAVLAFETVDFKRHKDVVVYFNKEYVATGLFPRNFGRRLGTLKQLREKSDYDDFYIASKSMAAEQIETSKLILEAVREYLKVEKPWPVGNNV